MTQTIEQLQAKVAELEAENARLIGRPIPLSTWQKMEQQLAAEQLNNKRLREALEHCMADGDFDTDDARTSFKEGMKALAIPRDTSALDAYVANKLKEATK